MVGGGGGAFAPPCPPPPQIYAYDNDETKSRICFEKS
jgi:hypothetical protein